MQFVLREAKHVSRDEDADFGRGGDRAAFCGNGMNDFAIAGTIGSRIPALLMSATAPLAKERAALVD